MSHVSDLPPAEPPRLAWGYFATLGWALLTYVIATSITLMALNFWDPKAFPLDLDFTAMMKDARYVSTTTILANLIQVGLLVLTVWFAGWKAKDYLAMQWPSWPELKIALAALIILLPAIDIVAYLLGQPIIPPFMTDIYRGAQSAGTLPLLWLAIVVVAPIAEEIIFRGFFFRGWVRSPHNPFPGVLLVTTVFAVLHMQYNWFGLLAVFLLGLLLTFIRWRSGSTLLPMVLHVIANAYAMLQTVVLIHWLS